MDVDVDAAIVVLYCPPTPQFIICYILLNHVKNAKHPCMRVPARSTKYCKCLEIFLELVALVVDMLIAEKVAIISLCSIVTSLVNGSA